MDIKVSPIIVYTVHLFDGSNKWVQTMDHLPTKEDAQLLGESWLGKVVNNLHIRNFNVSPLVVIPNVAVTASINA